MLFVLVSLSTFSETVLGQFLVTVAASIVLAVFVASEGLGINQLYYQALVHVVPALACLYCRSRQDAAAARKRRNGDDWYWWACFFSFVEHLMYFVVFMCRNVFSETDLSTMTPNRALENEVSTLCTTVLLPMGVDVDVAQLTKDYGDLINSVAQTGGPGAETFGYDWSVMYNGQFFYFYQIAEGITHLSICIGALMYMSKYRDNFDASIFWLYEVGMIVEWIVYGPIYFWALTGAWIMSFSSTNPTLKFLSFIFMGMHHLGYIVDSWSCHEVARNWRATWKNSNSTKALANKEKAL